MKKNEISIGRSKINDLVIQHKEVSSFHSKLVFQSDGTLWIHDLDSTNGVYVNGIRIKTKNRVLPGDQIKLGPCDFDWQKALLVGDSLVNEQQQFSDHYTPKKSSSTIKWVVISFTLLLISIAFFTTDLINITRELVSEETQTWRLKNAQIVYDISCLVEDTEGGGIIKVLGDAKKEWMGVDSVEVEVKEEEEVSFNRRRRKRKRRKRRRSTSNQKLKWKRRDRLHVFWIFFYLAGVS